MILLVGTVYGETEEQKENWIPEIYKSTTGGWSPTAPHPLNYGWSGGLIDKVRLILRLTQCVLR